MDVWFKKACYTLLGFLLAIAVASTPAITFACTPIQAQWDEVNYPVANCSRIAPTYTTVVALFVATDILVVILPFYLMVDCAHSSAKKNLQLAFAFLLASLYACPDNPLAVLVANSLQFLRWRYDEALLCVHSEAQCPGNKSTMDQLQRNHVDGNRARHGSNI